jgi:hypothetical protein
MGAVRVGAFLAFPRAFFTNLIVLLKSPLTVFPSGNTVFIGGRFGLEKHWFVLCLDV